MGLARLVHQIKPCMSYATLVATSICSVLSHSSTIVHTMAVHYIEFHQLNVLMN